jgi:hypothetical protein
MFLLIYDFGPCYLRISIRIATRAFGSYQLHNKVMPKQCVRDVKSSHSTTHIHTAGIQTIK